MIQQQPKSIDVGKMVQLRNLVSSERDFPHAMRTRNTDLPHFRTSSLMVKEKGALTVVKHRQVMMIENLMDDWELS